MATAMATATATYVAMGVAKDLLFTSRHGDAKI